jgi:hypothetical protein
MRVLCVCVCLQVAIIRQVEVDIEGQIEQQKAAHKDERSKLNLWSGKAKQCAAQIEERDGEWWGG